MCLSNNFIILYEIINLLGFTTKFKMHKFKVILVNSYKLIKLLFCWFTSHHLGKLGCYKLDHNGELYFINEHALYVQLGFSYLLSQRGRGVSAVGILIVALTIYRWVNHHGYREKLKHGRCWRLWCSLCEYYRVVKE